MQRSDGPAIRDTIIWFAAFAVTGGLGYLTWGTWWAVPCFIAYGVLYGSSTDSRWHECGHGTAFKTRWMNDALYQIASFMVLREPTPWRWSHTRHHTDTLIVGRDPEIAVPRPPDIAGILMSLLILKSGPKEIKRVFMHCFGKLHPEEKEYIPASEYPKVFRTARIWVAIWAAVVGGVLRDRLDPAGHVCRHPAVGLWRLALSRLRADAACGHGRGRARPSAELAHRLHEPGVPLPLLEHELPRRASHVPDGPLSRAAGAARGDEALFPDTL